MHFPEFGKYAVLVYAFIRSFQQVFVGEERLRDEPKECLRAGGYHNIELCSLD